jgi:hypothetical protein
MTSRIVHMIAPFLVVLLIPTADGVPNTVANRLDRRSARVRVRA